MTKIIAEIGCNHMGSVENAIKMVNVAKNYCNANTVKFQKRNVLDTMTIEQYRAPHPVPSNSYGKTYGEHREFLELSMDEHNEIKRYCDKINIEYSCSVWDLESAKNIIGLNTKFLKIPSPCNLKFDMINYICENFNGEIHLSLGMTTREEERLILSIFDDKKRLKDLVLYSCTSSYPVSFDDVCLMEIRRIKELWGKIIKGVGFSGHHLGIAIDIGAITLGAKYIERHFTLDRTNKGTDHAASLEPDGLRKLVRDSIAIDKALSYKKSEILKCEKEQRKKFKKGLLK